MKASVRLRSVSQRSLHQWLPVRKKESHKGDYGKILMICGSKGFTGAPALAARAAVRSGAGLVFVGVPESIYPIVASKLDEPMVFPLPEENGKLSAQAIAPILKRLSACDVCLVGCGLGISEGTGAVVRAILENAQCPVVLDADGINVIRHCPEILRQTKCDVILTPHAGEFARLGGDLKTNGRLREVLKMYQKTGSVVLLKGNRTLVCGPEGIYVNRTGNPGMATGGSGDVLAGIIAAFLGQGLTPTQAAAAGAWIHGAAGNLCADEIGEYGMLPSDIIERLPYFLY